ncbi:MAG TPA: hypothetical protein VGI63_07325 [Verrucomicrobiae bacterium]
MKKMILTGTVILALAGASLQAAHAGDREWATVGKVLTGMAVVGLVAAVVDGHAHGSVSYSYGAPAYCPPLAPLCNYTYCPAPVVPAVYCPPPVVVYRAPVVVYPAHRFVRYEGRRGCW